MGWAKVRQLPGKPVKAAVARGLRIPLVVLLAVCPNLFGCATPAKRIVEAPPSPVVQPDQPQQMSKQPPPELNAVQEAVKRVFKDSVFMDTSRKPAFLAGDFNGDLSQDIAVILKPSAEKLSDLNEEFPTWLLRDPLAANQSQIPRLRVGADEVLLAIIHGYGPSGWRDPQATQTYLLKNVVGSGMQAQQPKDAAKANQGKRTPQLRGDVIAEALGGTSGYLYYAGATYSWYDPKTFAGVPEPGMFHGVRERKVKK